MKPTKYYDKIYDSINPEHMSKIREMRIDNHTELSTMELHAREKNLNARTHTKKQI